MEQDQELVAGPHGTVDGRDPALDRLARDRLDRHRSECGQQVRGDHRAVVLGRGVRERCAGPDQAGPRAAPRRADRAAKPRRCAWSDNRRGAGHARSTPVRACAAPGGRQGAGTWPTSRTAPALDTEDVPARALEWLSASRHRPDSAHTLRESWDIFPNLPFQPQRKSRGFQDGPCWNRTNNLGLKRGSYTGLFPMFSGS